MLKFKKILFNIQYGIVFGLFTLISLLPFFIIYWLSNFLFIIFYYLLPYRKKLARSNLINAFPQKSIEEIIKIEKQFYINFLDTFLELIKLITISEKELSKRYTSNYLDCPDLQNQDNKIQLITGHFMNWEIINLGISKEIKNNFLAVYMPLSSPIFEKFMNSVRTRFNTILIPATKFRDNFEQYENQGYKLMLIADQNPGGPGLGYWISFLNQYIPFVFGPEKGAKKNNTLVYYLEVLKKKRGYYSTQYKCLTKNPNDFEDGQLTKLFVEILEENIIKQPDIYLWTHKRWKFQLKNYPTNNFKIID